MNGLKLFLVILFIVGLLFIVGTTLGSTHNDDQSVQTPGWLSNLGAKLVVSQPLKLADLGSVSTGCLQQGRFVVPVGGSCLVTIKQATFVQRVATVQLVQGTRATLTLTQEKVLPVQETLDAVGAVTDNNLKVYPGKAHGMLEIKCLPANNAPACQLELK